ncbi:MAG TPA: hypothetical protein VFB27_03185 [Opitutaceae bacterium]|nr:hypothetical protein [Opitutaceae bacterium]
MPPRLPELQLRLRFPGSPPNAFGPGKAELLRLIAATGSIRDAAAGMKMSYNRAWVLVRAMNALFRQPLVAAARGGRRGGGAEITPTGRRVLAAYRHMETACLAAARPDWRTLRRLLRR